MLNNMFILTQVLFQLLSKNKNAIINVPNEIKHFRMWSIVIHIDAVVALIRRSEPNIAFLECQCEPHTKEPKKS